MTSSVDWDSILATGCPPLSAKLAIGFPLAELVTELQERATDSSSTDALNAAFSTFRRADDSVAEQSAAEDLRACLEQIAETYPELVAGSADLQSRLDEVMRSSERSSH
jgi:transketolase